MGAESGQIWTILRNVIILIALVYILIILLLFFFQSRLVFFPRKEIIMTPDLTGLAYEDIYFITEDRVELNGWFIPSDSVRAVILFCHGNAGNISHRMETIKLFNDLDLSVFIFDYRGFGGSAGRPSENGTYIDADAAWIYLTEKRNIDPRNIIVFGRSLGGAVAANLASERSVGGVIVESSFTSINDLGSEIYPFLPVRLLSRFEYNALEKIQKVQCPKLIIHSRDDEMISFKHGERLYEAAGESKEFLELSGTHNEGFLLNSERYKSKIDSFLNQISGFQK
ncbi:MAG: alpha/beta hydrolase [Candidatus Zixiibacteriota bacterium]|nr:MAG: alpha/beta hydrolase [candidate division Zixibacteria bacterium]